MSKENQKDYQPLKVTEVGDFELFNHRLFGGLLDAIARNIHLMIKPVKPINVLVIDTNYPLIFTLERWPNLTLKSYRTDNGKRNLFAGHLEADLNDNYDLIFIDKDVDFQNNINTTIVKINDSDQFVDETDTQCVIRLIESLNQTISKY